MTVQLSPWELFRDELERNIKPTKTQISEKYQFVQSAFSGLPSYNDSFERIVQVRLMAAYEQALMEYLHLNQPYLQASVKAEIIHIASIVEHLLQLTLLKFKPNSNIKRLPTFKNTIDELKKMDFFPGDMYTIVDKLRLERNKVHINAISILPQSDEDLHEYHNAVIFRRKLNSIVNHVKAKV